MGQSSWWQGQQYKQYTHHRNSNGTTTLRHVVGVGMQVLPARSTKQNGCPCLLVVATNTTRSNARILPCRRHQRSWLPQQVLDRGARSRCERLLEWWLTLHDHPSKQTAPVAATVNAGSTVLIGKHAKYMGHVRFSTELASVPTLPVLPCLRPSPCAALLSTGAAARPDADDQLPSTTVSFCKAKATPLQDAAAACASNLTADLWEWYLQRAGRSELTSSCATYVKAYVTAYGTRLPYIHDAGRGMVVVQFRQCVLSW
jgi:hypothetical protein